MAIDIDDNNTAIKYSGSWSTYSSTSTYGGSQYGGSSHKTTSSGASLTFTFQGTGIRIYCSVPGDDGTVLHSKIRIILDQNAAVNIDKDTHPVDFNDDRWYNSGTLSSGKHTITVTYTGGSSDAGFIFDRFNIDGTADGGSPAAAAPSPPPVTTPKTTTTPTATAGGLNHPATTTSATTTGANNNQLLDSVSLSGSIVSSAISTGVTSARPSSRPVTASSLSGHQEKTVTIHQVSTAADGTVSTQTSVIINTTARSRSDFPIGAIIGIVVAGVLMLLFLVLLLLFMRRRRRRNGMMMLSEGEHNGPAPRRSTVTPFPAPQPASSSSHDHSDDSHPDTQTRILNEKFGLDFDTVSLNTTPSSNTPFLAAMSEKADLFPNAAEHSSSDHSMYGPVLPEIDTGPLHFLYRDPVAPGPSSLAEPSTRPSSYMTGDLPPAYQSLRHLSTPAPPQMSPRRTEFGTRPS